METGAFHREKDWGWCYPRNRFRSGMAMWPPLLQGEKKKKKKSGGVGQLSILVTKLGRCTDCSFDHKWPVVWSQATLALVIITIVRHR